MVKGIAGVIGILLLANSGLGQIETQKPCNLREVPLGKKGDSLEGQRIFYSSSGEWIPPALPTNTACFGCCLIPLGGCLIGHKVFSKRPETTEVLRKRKLSIGLSYSPGVAYTGDELMREPETGPFDIDLTKFIYWNNILEVNSQYYFNPNWAVELGIGYLWAKMEDRRIHIGGSPGAWQFSGGVLSYSIYWVRVMRKESSSIGGGVEYYYTTGLDLEKEWWPSTSTITLKNWGRGLGGFLSLEYSKKVVPKINLKYSLLIRGGCSKEYKYSISESIEKKEKIDFHLSGVYIKIGISYNLLIKNSKRR